MKKALALLFILTFGLMGLQSPALAAPIPEKLNVQIWPEYDDNQILFMETLEFAQDAPLPIDVKMALPKGATVYWAGEVFGRSVSEDIQATPVTTDKGAYTEIAFTLTKARKAQVEARWDAVKIEGDQRTIDLDWTQQYEVKTTQFGFKAPSTSSQFTFSPNFTSIGQGPDKLEFYNSSGFNLVVGQQQPIKITYKRSATGGSITPQQQQDLQSQQGQGGAPTTGTPSNSNTILYGLIVVSAALVIFAIIRHQQGREDEAEYVETKPVRKPGKPAASTKTNNGKAGKKKEEPVERTPVPADVGDDFFED
ncbi:MAG: hypothetical protein ACYC1U_01410 [Candidatus Aquicultorales bacterium]